MSQRPSLLVHLFVDCIDTLHRTRPRGEREKRRRRLGKRGERRTPGA